MKVVILAGGFGSRLSEESQFRPKPMVEIGGMPMLWHIMKIYSFYGFNEFIICAGYKQHVIKEWFANYFLHTSDITFDFTSGERIIVHNKRAEPWKVTIVDTGLDTMTGGRVKRIRKYVDDEPFMLTYGDAVGDIDIRNLVAYHQTHGRIGTVSVYNYSQSKGVLEVMSDGQVNAFREKSDLDGDLIDQHRLHGVQPGAVRPHRERSDCLRAAADARTRQAEPADGLRSHEVLAVHGYDARKGKTGGVLGERQRTLEAME